MERNLVSGGVSPSLFEDRDLLETPPFLPGRIVLRHKDAFPGAPFLREGWLQQCWGRRICGNPGIGPATATPP